MSNETMNSKEATHENKNKTENESGQSIQAFLEFLHTRLKTLNDFQREIMRHEMSASANRQKIAGSNQGVISFNTDSWLWAVTSENRALNAQSGNLQILIVSSLQDGDIELFHKAKAADLILDTWLWIEWADGFEGSADDLIQRLDSMTVVRQIAGATCLACISNPNAVSTELLNRFSNVRVWSLVFHRLLHLALQSDNANNAARIADYALEFFSTNTAMLFVVDVDRLLSQLIRAHARAHVGTDINARLKPFVRVIGEDSHVALAEYYLSRRQFQQASAEVANIRLLSPTLPRAALISALAALELGDAAKAQCFVEFIEDQVTSLKIQTRIAQTVKNHAAELAALTDLHQLCPQDGETFVQLLIVLKRIGKHEIVTQLCLKNQEFFLDDEVVMATINKYLH